MSLEKNESHPVGKIGQVAVTLPSYFFVTFQGVLLGGEMRQTEVGSICASWRQMDGK